MKYHITFVYTKRVLICYFHHQSAAPTRQCSAGAPGGCYSVPPLNLGSKMQAVKNPNLNADHCEVVGGTQCYHEYYFDGFPGETCSVLPGITIESSQYRDSFASLGPLYSPADEEDFDPIEAYAYASVSSQGLGEHSGDMSIRGLGFRV